MRHACKESGLIMYLTFSAIETVSVCMRVTDGRQSQSVSRISCYDSHISTTRTIG